MFKWEIKEDKSKLCYYFDDGLSLKEHDVLFIEIMTKKYGRKLRIYWQDTQYESKDIYNFVKESEVSIEYVTYKDVDGNRVDLEYHYHLVLYKNILKCYCSRRAKKYLSG